MEHFDILFYFIYFLRLRTKIYGIKMEFSQPPNPRYFCFFSRKKSANSSSLKPYTASGVHRRISSSPRAKGIKIEDGHRELSHGRHQGLPPILPQPSRQTRVRNPRHLHGCRSLPHSHWETRLLRSTPFWYVHR